MCQRWNSTDWTALAEEKNLRTDFPKLNLNDTPREEIESYVSCNFNKLNI